MFKTQKLPTLLPLLVASDLKKRRPYSRTQAEARFANKQEWIAGAIKKALGELKGSGLKVVINEYTENKNMQKLIAPS